jgi:colanic acid/amylovoran biosynthesis protein
MANGGDAAILLSIVDVLRSVFPGEHEVTVIDPLPKVGNRHYPQFKFLAAAHFTRSGWFLSRYWRVQKIENRLRDLRLRIGIALSQPTLFLGPVERRAFNAYRSADIVVSTGGTYLVDHYGIASRLFEFELAHQAGKAVILYTQSLGPFKRRGYAAAVKPHLDRSPLILLRDERSKGYLLQLGIAADKMHVMADCVFGTARTDVLEHAAKADTNIRHVGVSVRSWTFFEGGNSARGMESYIEGVARAVEWLIKTHNCSVTFISTCQGIPEYGAKDSIVADKIAKKIASWAAPRVTVDHDFHNPIDLQKMLSGFDLVIATRMHMAILALSAGVPVLPIAYEFKTTELFNRLGMEKWVTQIEAVDPRTFPETVERFLSALPGIRKGLFEGVRKERDLALSAIDIVKDVTSHADGRN